MPRELNQYDLTVTFLNDIEGDNDLLLDFAMRLVTCAAIIAIFLIIIALILKLLGKSDGDEDSGDEGPSESSRLFSSKEDVLFSSYGTGENDEYYLESGGQGSCSSSPEDLYDEKICVICYDDQRNCFFVPCGHCITCYACAKRIIKEESKSCPICRGHIHKKQERTKEKEVVGPVKIEA